MTSLLLMRGYPGSGKTTLAKDWVAAGIGTENKRARVSRDEMRLVHFGTVGERGNLGYETEQHLTDIIQDAVRKLLKRGYDVVVDDLNLRRRYCVDWAAIALEQQVRFEICDVRANVETCIRRDEQRRAMGGRGVGAKAITELAQKFPIMRWEDPERILGAAQERQNIAAGDWLVYTPKPGTPRAVLVDLDGTVASKVRGDGARGWHEYHRVGEDLPRQEVIDMVNLIALSEHALVIFMSGRKSYCRPQTVEWLREHMGAWTTSRPLFMRADDDNREDSIVKHELFDRFVRERYDVVGAFDDRDRVVAMWRAIGLQVYQVAPGNF